MKITRIYTGADGESHFEEQDIPLHPIDSSRSLSEPVVTKSVIFRETGPEYDLDFHTAPRRQYVVNLTGSMELEVGSGEKRILGPGSILLAEDTTGRGHKSRAVNNEPRRSLFITLE